MRKIFVPLGLAVVCSLVSAQAQTASADPAGRIEFTPAQSAEGKIAYDRACRQCHGRGLDDGDFGPPLRGSVFARNWGGKSVAELFTYTSTRMPSDAPGSLGARAYAGIVAYILQSNDVASGLREMPSIAGGLSSMRIPGAGQSRAAPGGGLTPGVALPNQPPPSTLLDHITPVTPAMLAKPPQRMAHLETHLRRPRLQPAQTNRPDQRQEHALGLALVAATRPEHRDSAGTRWRPVCARLPRPGGSSRCRQRRSAVALSARAARRRTPFG